MRPCTGIFAGERRFVEDDSDDSRSSSSLGRDSDLSGGEDCADSEVQSSFIKGPLDTMDVLEEVLPIKRGISKFYDGKSKSFTSLADATSASSIKEFAKPENPYARKRKNLLPQINFLDWNCGYHLRDLETGTSKRTANSGGNTVVPGLTRSCSRSNNCKEEPHSMLLSSSTCPPPLHPHTKRTPSNVSCLPSRPQNFHFRSFSLSDLQCAASASSNV